MSVNEYIIDMYMSYGWGHSVDLCDTENVTITLPWLLN